MALGKKLRWPFLIVLACVSLLRIPWFDQEKAFIRSDETLYNMLRKDWWEERRIQSAYNAAHPNATQIVWQTWKSRWRLPLAVRRHRHAQKRRHFTHAFRLLGDADVDRWMRHHWADTDTWRAFDTLNPALGALRADFWRYCVLYRHDGGIYLDLDSAVELPLHQWVGSRPILSSEPHPWEKSWPCEKIWGSFPERMPGNNTSFTQWLLVFPTPGHIVLKEVIRLMTQAILGWRDDNTTLQYPTSDKVICLTGPAMFSRAVANTWNQSDALVVGPNYNDMANFRKGNVDKVLKRIKPKYSDGSMRLGVPIKKEGLLL